MAKIPRALILEREKRVWEMRMRGATYERIANEIGVTFGGVSKILQRLHKRYREKNMDSIEKMKFEQIGELSNIADEAYQAWERSKKSASEDHEGDPRYLSVYIKAKEDMRKIVGADAPLKQELTGKDGKSINVDMQNKIDAQELLKAVINKAIKN